MVRRALLIALLLGSTACVTTKPLAPADRDVAVTIDDLQHWVTRAELSTTEEHLERKDQLGNSFLSYRYEGASRRHPADLQYGSGVRDR